MFVGDNIVTVVVKNVNEEIVSKFTTKQSNILMGYNYDMYTIQDASAKFYILEDNVNYFYSLNDRIDNIFYIPTNNPIRFYIIIENFIYNGNKMNIDIPFCLLKYDAEFYLSFDVKQVSGILLTFTARDKKEDLLELKKRIVGGYNV